MIYIIKLLQQYDNALLRVPNDVLRFCFEMSISFLIYRPVLDEIDFP
jgi:hypothetical protein